MKGWTEKAIMIGLKIFYCNPLFVQSESHKNGESFRTQTLGHFQKIPWIYFFWMSADP